MGKIRVKTLGIDEKEKQEEKRLKQKKEAKKMAKGAHGGERVTAVGPSEKELEMAITGEKEIEKPAKELKVQKDEKKVKKTAKRNRSKNYQTRVKLIDKSKTYPLSDALKTLSEFKKANFDETVELHLNTITNGISETLTLPHGTGKNIKVAIADDKLISEVEKGKIDFDVLISTPSMMPKLAKVARILGPRGLMPNPKNGTITDKPEDLIKKYEGGQIVIKTESKAPIIHATVGKISFGEKKLADNIKVLIDAIKKENINKAVLKSTMSPGIKVKI